MGRGNWRPTSKHLRPQSVIVMISSVKDLLFLWKCLNEWISSTQPFGSSWWIQATIQSYGLSLSSTFSRSVGPEVFLLVLPPCPSDCSWNPGGALRVELCFWDALNTTVDFTQGCWSLLTPDGLGLKDRCHGSSLETGFWIPVVDQSIPTCTLLLQPSFSIQPFLGSPLSWGWDWLRLFWLVEWGGSKPAIRLDWHPLSTFQGVISGLGSHSSSFWGVCAPCPSRSNAETRLVEDSIPAGITHVVAALLCWKCSRIAASATSSTDGGWVNFSRICVAATIIPLVRLLTKSGAESILVYSGKTSIWGITLRVSDLLEPIPKPPISMATLVSVWMLQGEPRVWSCLG